MGIEMAECEDEELYGKEYLQWKKQTLDKQVNHYLKKMCNQVSLIKKTSESLFKVEKTERLKAIPVFVEMPFGKKQIFATSLSGRVCKQNIIFKNRNCRLDESIKACQFTVLGQIAIGSNGWGLLLFTFTFFSSAHFPKCR